MRLAIVVSHPIQYYVPLYQRLARRDDLSVKVFFTWHAGQAPVEDQGFRQRVSWDIPLTGGYDWESVPNTSANPGTHHFFGLQNPSLVRQVFAWRPDAVHVTGWAWMSHLQLLRACSRNSIPALFRGDSNLIGRRQSGAAWWIKRAALRYVYDWPSAFLYVGHANREYYEAFGVESSRLYHCPHSIDVARFAGPADVFDREASEWRRQLDVADRPVLLFAGKFEPQKRPLELMRAVQKLGDPQVVLIMVGAGELEHDVRAMAASAPGCFRVLPFQNQSRMPIVYRLGDVFIMPSSGETWGLAVNEALACGRPVVVSDRVGCAADVIVDSCGRVLPCDDTFGMAEAGREFAADSQRLCGIRSAASARAWAFDLGQTEASLMECLATLCAE